ncbi:MAG: hypothetical protein RR322_05445, partial [Oscillospiraceae bacterium]
AADIFFDNGLHLTKTGNNRVDGWFAVKEWLKIDSDEQGILTSKLKIFDSCKNLIRTLPSVQTDKLNPNDVANSPHELTHAPDALRGFCIYKVKGNNTNCNNQQTVEEIFKINRNKINSSKGGKINVI